jgi:hypothetical protein
VDAERSHIQVHLEAMPRDFAQISAASAAAEATVKRNATLVQKSAALRQQSREMGIGVKALSIVLATAVTAASLAAAWFLFSTM